jgi:hypothetical protein
MAKSVDERVMAAHCLADEAIISSVVSLTCAGSRTHARAVLDGAYQRLIASTGGRLTRHEAEALLKQASVRLVQSGAITVPDDPWVNWTLPSNVVQPTTTRSAPARLRRVLSARTRQSFVVVAARQELDAVRSYLDLEGARREPYNLSKNWSAERLSIDQGIPIEFILMLAPGQGLEDMSDLLSFIQGAKPKTVILVGMMAGIAGKSRLLDVQAPRNIINGVRLGTRSGRIVPEPHGRDVDPILHNRLQSLDRNRHNIADIPLVTHKHTVCVAAKFDDLTPELAQAALASDPENIVGIEMEGAALTAKQATQRRNNDATGYLMIKGVADYAGANLTHEEVVTLRSVLEPFEGENSKVLLAEPDPTTNKRLKLLLQKIATIRAMRVALALLAEGGKLG